MPATIREGDLRHLYQAHAESALARGRRPTPYAEWRWRWTALKDAVVLPDLSKRDNLKGSPHE